jgi:transcriptional regulator with XRE-family HTH domain
MISIAERIRRWRESREDLSRAGLARSVGVSRQAFQLWETGQTEPTLANIEKVAAAIGVSMSVFWGEPPAAKARAKAS